MPRICARQSSNSSAPTCTMVRCKLETILDTSKSLSLISSAAWLPTTAIICAPVEAPPIKYADVSAPKLLLASEVIPSKKEFNFSPSEISIYCFAELTLSVAFEMLCQLLAKYILESALIISWSVTISPLYVNIVSWYPWIYLA